MLAFIFKDKLTKSKASYHQLHVLAYLLTAVAPMSILTDWLS